MKVSVDCGHCLLMRVHYQTMLATDDRQLQFAAIKKGIEKLDETFREGVPAGFVSTSVHRSVYDVLGCDPYLNEKKLSNEIAVRMLPYARSLIEKGDPDPVERLRRAFVISAIGNSFDFGVHGFDVDVDRFDEVFETLYKKGLDIDDTIRIIPYLGNVLIFEDNCGEIVFDMLLFEELRNYGSRVGLVVRGAPILTDATLEDVVEFGLDEKVDYVLTTGSNAVGVCMAEVPPQLIEAIDNATLIISKGMANYETLSEHDLRPILYILRTKCAAVARDIGVEVDKLIAKLVE